MRTAHFRIEAIHPSLNTWSRLHPHKVARMKLDYGWFVRAAVQQAIARQTWDGKIFERAILRVIHHFDSNRRHDPSNYAPKFWEDPLVALGVLRDDDFAHIALRIEQGPNAKPAWTEIIIEEVTE